MGLKNNGLLYLWGSNSYGELGYGPLYGDPNYDIRKSPLSPLDGNAYIAIAAGKQHAHAIRADGTLWAWGTGEQGELGILVDRDLDGQIDDIPYGPVLPVQVGTSSNWTALFGGWNATFGLQTDGLEVGQLWVWGSGGNIGLGSGTFLSLKPARLGTPGHWENNYASVSVSQTHTLALKADGSLYGWGSNDVGQLGLPIQDNGAYILENYQKYTPFQLKAPDTFLAVGAGEGFSALIRSDGFMLTSGTNDEGQLANGSINTSGESQYFFENADLGVADLEGTGLVVSTQVPTAGSTVSASFSLKNGGSGEITSDFLLEAVLSPDTNFNNPDAIPLTFSGGASTFEVTQDLNSGVSTTIPLVINLPAQILQGEYYLVVQADSTDLIEETDEENNSAATEESFEFFPDLIFSDTIGLDLDPLNPSYDPGDLMEITINIENTGTGYIPAGTKFDIRVFLSPDQTSDNSGGIDLDPQYTVTLAADFLPGQSLDYSLDVDLPLGLGTGAFYLGGVIDVAEQIVEQTELLSDTNVVIREDGEANNEFFTDTAEVVVDGIPLDEAMDDPGRVFSTSGDATWFGQDQVFTTGNDAAQSPSINAGQSAAFGTSFTDPVVITFDWRSVTSSSENKLIYRVVGGATGSGVNEISGDTNGWLSAQKVVPAGAQVEWKYVEGVDAPNDAVYVDNLQMFVIDKPDLVIDGINLTSGGLIIDSGSYVLNRDRLDLNVNTRNQGTSTGPLDEFAVSVYLSKDRNFNRPDGDPDTADDILIRQFTEDEVFASGASAVNGLSINLPLDLAPGDYYVIAYIDDYTDADGNLIAGTSLNVGQIDEYSVNSFPGETNNLFVSADPVVQIVALPDLTVTAVNPEPDYYFIKDASGNPNLLNFDFTIANEGLAAVNGDIRVRVLLSTDSVLDPDTDYVVLDYLYSGGLSAAGVAGNSVNINPDGVDIRTDVPVGELLYFGVYIDAVGAIEELNENNNGRIYSEKDFVFSDVSVEEAFDFDDGAGNDAINDETPPFEGDIPWVGQSVTTFDGTDAAMSVNIGNSETSAFETNILVETDTFITFRWKVSSQNDIYGRDELNFYVDDLVNPVASIAGIEGDWEKVSYLVKAGTHTLRWAYVKDDLFSSGQDRGWVDGFSFQVPNLEVTSISIDDTTAYVSGDTIDTWSVTVTNNGLADVPPTPSFDVQLRVSGDNSWGNDGDFVLLTISDNQGLAVGESRTYSEATDGPLSIPLGISLDASYYFGAYVDWSDENPDSGVIPESDEEDNVTFTSSASVDIAPAVTLNEAIDNLGLTLTVGGPGGWYGVDTTQIPGGASDGVDAAKSGSTASGQTSYYQAVVEGPAVLSFDWKVSSRAGANFLEFSINDVVQERISGEVDWESQEIFIPAGTQELRWSYRKTGDGGAFEDAGWVDQVALAPFSDPELVLTGVNYTPGEYVLDVAGIAGQPNQLLGTEYLDVTVEAENQGVDYTGPAFSTADLEVRLSLDRIYGNGDDIVLGTVSQVEGTLEAGDLMRFLGPIQLGDSIPEDFYYLMARVDSNDEVDEYDEDNNVWISENRDIQITRLPALRIYNPDPDGNGPDSHAFEGSDGERFFLDPTNGVAVPFDLDEDLFHYAEAPMRLRFAVQNYGLDRVDGNIRWTVQVNLQGAPREKLDEATDLDKYVGAFTAKVTLGEFTVQELMEGRSDAKPDGDIVDFDVELALPGGARLNDIIDSDTYTYEDYLWSLEIVLDSTNAIEESEIVSESPALIAAAELPWWILNPFETTDFFATNSDASDGLFGINFQPSLVAATDWEAVYPGYPTSDTDNLLAYAFNRNPVDGDTAGGQFPGTYGTTEFEGKQYLSITFDFVTRATDLVYTVEASNDASFPALGTETLLVIHGPFDELTGAASLTGDGGLADQSVNPNVLNVLDQGYSAKITVKDNVDVSSASMRFIRVNVSVAP